MTLEPENIGDIYEVRGYCQMPISYGVAYMASDPERPGHWCWWLHMEDGDLYPWPKGGMPDFSMDSIALFSRNPLPQGHT